MKHSFQAIVVGAGPAGASAAMAMARAGLDVALLERGNFPGEKNMFGGMLHRLHSLETYIPEFWNCAPVERYVMKKAVTFLAGEASFNVQFETGAFDEPPYNGYTIFRPRFDRWLAGEAVKAGATLITRVTVDDVILQGERVAGVSVAGREGKLYAPVVVAADGVLSFVAMKAGLRRPKFRPDQMAVGVKALYDLPKEVIDDRFGLTGNQGLANEFVGCTGEVRGGACLYTNYDTVSAAIVVHLGSLMKSGRTPYDLLNTFTAHPQLQKLLKGGRLLEYSAHVIPEGGYDMVPELVGDGILVAGDAAAFCNVTGLNLEGINLASHSGILAGETVAEACTTGDFSKNSLENYRKKLKESFVLKDLKQHRRAPKMLHNDRIYQAYPQLICTLMEKIYRIDGSPRDNAGKLALQAIHDTVGLKNIIADTVGGWRAL